MDDIDLMAMDDEAREREAEEALEACLKAGVSKDHLKVLAREAGCVRWALQHSLRKERHA